MNSLKELVDFIENIEEDEAGRDTGSGRDAFGFCLEDAFGKQAEIKGQIFHIVDGKDPIEGGGEDVWYVFRIEGNDSLYRIKGYFNSYDGTDWEETGPIEEVKAIPVTAYEYHPVTQ